MHRRALRAVIVPAALVLAAATVLLATPTAQAEEVGGPINSAPNARYGCEAGPRLANANGDYAVFASGSANCTWIQNPTVGGGPSGYVPRSGRVTAVAVRTGPNPAPLRFTVVRFITGLDANGNVVPNSTACCFGQAMSPTFRMRPNRINRVALNLPIETGIDRPNNAAIEDFIGFSADANAGFIPVSATKQPNTNDFAQPGNPNVGMHYPQIAPGQVRNDGTTAPSHVIHARFTVCFNGRGGPSRTAARTAGSRCGAVVSTGRVRATKKGKIKLPLKCTGACSGRIVIKRGSGNKKLAKPKKFKVGTRGKGKVGIKLNGAGKKAVRGKRSVKAKIIIKAQGERRTKKIRIR